MVLDITLRPLKDQIFDPLCKIVPASVQPLHVTLLGLLAGLASCWYALSGHTILAVSFWVTNRALDCLDGALARSRHQSSDLGGFLDLLADFIVYSLIPVACAQPSLPRNGRSKVTEQRGQHLSTLPNAIALLEASFHVNNFVLFYIAAILEKQKVAEKTGKSSRVKELTTLAMRPALIEGTESALFFTAMLILPNYIEILSWSMATLVAVGIVQRVVWLVPTLG
ncbi:MAG: hypothetical protein M1828_004684 [Chrysothrix sp. TS-e1954]|nr:MAG: hypothetical protein M1828_004684 [Chrysothrix sp. TS-e1954]